MTTPIRIYVASRLHHAALWQNLRQYWRPDILITSSWIDTNVSNTSEAKLPASLFETAWAKNDHEIHDCDALFAYEETADYPLRGTLIEIGLALANAKPVLLAGSGPSFGTWQFHPRCHRVESLEEARQTVALWQNGYARMDFDR